jgi:prepilin-type N-terminal cleavage/methylation domain-containing protein
MIHDRGFTVVELMVALTITLAISAALANVVAPARAAFDRLPAELDLQQRGRTAIDVLTQAVRSAGRDVAAAESLGLFGDLLPAITPLAPNEDGTATMLSAIVAVVNGAQGVLESDQPGPGGAMTLAPVPCPNVNDVCGFLPGSTAAIANGLGQFDVFIVASTNPAARLLMPVGTLSRAYPAGAVIAEVDHNTFRLSEQADHTHSLVRETAAGAVLPIVDFVSALTFSVLADEAGVRQVEVLLRVQAPSEVLRRALADRVFKTTIALRNAP